MAMTRWIEYSALAALCVACTPAPQTAPTQKSSLAFHDAPPQADLENVAVLTPLEPETYELWQALVLELKEDFNITTVPISRNTGPDDLARALNRSSPQCVVVIDNRTLQLYRSLQNFLPQREFPPAVVVMTSFLERAIGRLRSATGISYEAPLISSIVTLREITPRVVRRVGVVHRRMFSNEVAAQAKLAEVEKVQLQAVVVSDEPSPEQIEDALDHLVVDQEVDAIWVLNDNRLLTPQLLASSWLPVLRFRPVPVVVGVAALVHPDVHFGTVAVIPHHERLGVQAANLVFDLADNDWRLSSSNQVELPLSVSTVVDVEQVVDHFGFRADALAKIDKAVQ
jgi:putative ABC transport system substrate-binding protein